MNNAVIQSVKTASIVALFTALFLTTFYLKRTLCGCKEKKLWLVYDSACMYSGCLTALWSKSFRGSGNRHAYTVQKDMMDECLS